MRILIIEDEPKTAAYLAKGLTEASYVVDVATEGEEGLRLAELHPYSLIICDVMLPKRDGWNVVSTLRGSGVHVPIIFLTARDAVDERVKGLDIGADDYLIKPFAFSELIARVRSLLRRGPARQHEVLTVEDLTIDLVRHKVTRAGTEILLTAKEFSLLALLVKRKGEVLTRTAIAEQVWDMNFDSDTNVVDVAIRRLRQKVDDPFEKRLIETVRGMGYVIREPAYC